MAQNVVINGVTYSDVPEVDIPKSGGGTAPFYDTSDADAVQGDVLSGKTYYKDGKKTGSMTNNGDTSGDISSKDGTVTIPAGYTSGGTVGIDSTEKAKIVSGNIKSGVTLLGVLISNNKSQAVVEERVNELTREVREHNNFAKRMPVVEQQIKDLTKNVNELWEYHKEG